MTTRRAMKGALRGFLGTFTSRNADYRGYWLHGQPPADDLECTIDLLALEPTGEEPAQARRRLAARRFAEQVRKAGFGLESVREATLWIERVSGVVEGWHGESRSVGHQVRFSVRVVTDDGRDHLDECTHFVAPHDPEKERRRLEGKWET